MPMRDAPDENQHCHVPRSTFNFALGPFNPIIALLIATIKATLVVLFFIHVKKRERKADQRRSRLRLLLCRDSANPVFGGLPDSILVVISLARGIA
jgi:hypothetical protein